MGQITSGLLGGLGGSAATNGSYRLELVDAPLGMLVWGKA